MFRNAPEYVILRQKNPIFCFFYPKEGGIFDSPAFGANLLCASSSKVKS